MTDELRNALDGKIEHFLRVAWPYGFSSAGAEDQIREAIKAYNIGLAPMLKQALDHTSQYMISMALTQRPDIEKVFVAVIREGAK